MPIRIEDLPPKYQEQVAKKALGQVERKKKNKFHAEKTEWNKIKFDSRAEQYRYQQLMAMLKAGEITELKIHPEFTLLEGYTRPDGKRVRRMAYKPDFCYLKNGEMVVEDVKSTATKTTDYQMRKKLLLDKYGVEVVEIER